MSTETPLTDRVRALDDATFAGFVADLWRRAGWTVERKEATAGVAVASRGRDADDDRPVERVVLYAYTPDATLVDADDLREAVDARRRFDADGVTAVTPCGFTTDALDVADAYGVDVLGPDALTRAITAFGAVDLLPDLDGESPH